MRRPLSYSVARALHLLTLLAGAAGVVRADVVATTDRRPAVDVQVLSLREGRLHYQIGTGREVSRPIEEVTYLQITGWPLFNLAEKQQRDAQLRPAAASYERVLADLARQQAGVDEAARLDRRLLTRCRLAGVYDRQGQFDRAVAVYLEVIEQMPAVVETLRPANVPAAGSTFLDAARTQVEQAINRHSQDQIAVSLARWRDGWAGGATRPSAATEPSGSATSQPSAGVTTQAVRRTIELAQTSVEAGRFDQALERLDALEDAPPGVWLAESYYWRGRAWLGLAQGQPADAAVVSRQRAGLAFIRVFVHFPGHPLAPECLYRAGELCARFGHTGQAARLWSELTAAYPGASPWAEQARQAGSRIRKETPSEDSHERNVPNR